MPTLPTVQLRGQSPRLQLPEVGPPAGAYIAKGLDQFGEVMGKISDGADRAEAARRVAEARALFASAIDEEKINRPDADEFSVEASRRVDDLFAGAIETDNPRVRTLVQNALQDDLIRGKTIIRQETFRKKKDQGTADYLITKDQLAKSSVGADEAIQRKNASDLAVLQAGLVGSGYLTKEEAAKDRLAFTKKIAADTMNLAAAQQPRVFYDDFNAGKFSGNDPVDVQMALDIADRSTRAREDKIKRDTAWASREAERAFVGLAEKHQLDISELEDTAQFYQWSDEKVDKIKQMQIGLRESSPFSDKLIADALDPINKANPSMADVNRASQNLIGLSDRVSPDSREFRAAMDKLRGLHRSVRISSEMSENRAERNERKAQIDARREVTQLMNKYEPRLRADRRKAQQGDWYDRIDRMSPAEARSFVDQIRRDYEAKRKERSPTSLDLNEFKSLNK